MKKLNTFWKAFLQKNRVKHVLSLTPTELTFLHDIQMKKIMARIQIIDTTWHPKEVVWIEAIYNKDSLDFYNTYSDITNGKRLFLYDSVEQFYRPISDIFPHFLEKETVINTIFSDFIISLNLTFKK